MWKTYLLIASLNAAFWFLAGCFIDSGYPTHPTRWAISIMTVVGTIGCIYFYLVYKWEQKNGDF